MQSEEIKYKAPAREASAWSLPAMAEDGRLVTAGDSQVDVVEASSRLCLSPVLHSPAMVDAAAALQPAQTSLHALRPPFFFVISTCFSLGSAPPTWPWPRTVGSACPFCIDGALGPAHTARVHERVEFLRRNRGARRWRPTEGGGGKEEVTGDRRVHLAPRHEQVERDGQLRRIEKKEKRAGQGQERRLLTTALYEYITY